MDNTFFHLIYIMSLHSLVKDTKKTKNLKTSKVQILVLLGTF